MKKLHVTAEDIQILQELLDEPSVLKGAKANFNIEIDPLELLATSQVVAFPGHAAFCYEPIPPFDGDYPEYYVHSLVMPSDRGNQALRMAMESLQWIFTFGRARKVYTMCMRNRRDAIMFAIWAGMKLQLETKNWKVLSIDFIDWVNQSDGLRTTGSFLAQLCDLVLPEDPNGIQAKWLGYLRRSTQAGYPLMGLQRYDSFRLMLDLYAIQDFTQKDGETRIVMNDTEIILGCFEEGALCLPLL